jgi:hypothetical protein
MGITFSKACVFRWVEAGIHAGENGETSGWREGK